MWSAASTCDGAFTGGQTSNPLKFLKGFAYRRFASQSPHVFPDFAPATLLDGGRLAWIGFGIEERRTAGETASVSSITTTAGNS